MALFYNKDGKLIPITSNAVNFNVTEIKEELTDIKSKIPKTTNSTDNQLVNQTYVKDALLNVHTHDNKKVLDKVSEDTTKDRLKFNGRVYLAEEDVPETAIKAIGDSEGNKIVDTYVTKVSFDKNNTELQNSITSEAKTREAKDTELQNSITSEAKTREAKDTELQNSIASEIKARVAKDTELQNSITSEAKTRVAKDTELQNSITSEVKTREAKDTELQNSIASEAKSREAKDTELQNSIASEIKARVAKDTELQNSITSEVKTREAKDTELQNSIASEAKSREAKDTELQNSIASEIKARVAKDTELQNSITSEAKTRVAKDTELQNSITSEVKTREAKDTELQNSIASEAKSREAKDTELQNSIASEIKARVAKDTELQNSITSEVKTREAKDTELQNSITSEAKARAAKDTELQNSIDTLNGTGAGSISKTVSDAIISIINGAPEKFDTLKEISDWITTHETSAASMNTQIQSNKSNIDALSKKVDNMESVNTKLNISGNNGTAEGVSNLINKLNVGESTPVDEDYYVAQYVNGGTTTTSFHRRPLKALWEYIKNKLSSTFGLGGTKNDNAIVRFDGTTGAIQNTGVAIDDNNNIIMPAIGATGTSNKITFNGSSDGADIYYQTLSSDQGNLVLNTRDDSNCYIQFAYNGDFHAYISTIDGVYHGTATNAQNATSAKSVNGTVIASSLRIPTTAPSIPQNGDVWLV